MTHLDSSLGKFISQNFYVYVEKDKSSGRDIVKAEEKGVWTWIKANVLYRESYRLPRILQALKSIPCNQISLDDRQKISCLKERINTQEYLKNHTDDSSQKTIEELNNIFINLLKTPNLQTISHSQTTTTPHSNSLNNPPPKSHIPTDSKPSSTIKPNNPIQPTTSEPKPAPSTAAPFSISHSQTTTTPHSNSLNNPPPKSHISTDSKPSSTIKPNNPIQPTTSEPKPAPSTAAPFSISHSQPTTTPHSNSLNNPPPKSHIPTDSKPPSTIKSNNPIQPTTSEPKPAPSTAPSSIELTSEQKTIELKVYNSTSKETLTISLSPDQTVRDIRLQIAQQLQKPVETIDLFYQERNKEVGFKEEQKLGDLDWKTIQKNPQALRWVEQPVKPEIPSFAEKIDRQNKDPWEGKVTPEERNFANTLISLFLKPYFEGKKDPKEGRTPFISVCNPMYKDAILKIPKKIITGEQKAPVVEDVLPQSFKDYCLERYIFEAAIHLNNVYLPQIIQYNEDLRNLNTGSKDPTGEIIPIAKRQNFIFPDNPEEFHETAYSQFIDELCRTIPFDFNLSDSPELREKLTKMGKAALNNVIINSNSQKPNP